MSSDRRSVALVTHGFGINGGVGSVTRWLRDGLRATGCYSVDVHSLATSSRDVHSRRLIAASSWLRPSLRSTDERGASEEHWGANLVEFEVMRYRPRRELLRALSAYDLIQVVAGSPAWAATVRGVTVPVVLQVASLVAWERESRRLDDRVMYHAWRRSMTRLTTVIERKAVRDVNAVLVENDDMLEWVRSAGQMKVLKATPGVDTTVYLPALQRPADGYLLSVCRLGDPRKGLDRTIRAFAEMVRRQNTTPDLVLAGRGSIDQLNARLVRDLGLSARIIIRTDVSPSDLVELYRGASVFVQTSHEEGLGLTVLEAMSSGLPVVATETAGSRQTVTDGVTGFLVPQLAADALTSAFADAVMRIVNDPQCPFGANGRKKCIEEFSSERALDRFLEVYDSLLPSRGYRPRAASGQGMQERKDEGGPKANLREDS